jgi:hypothetical protein
MHGLQILAEASKRDWWANSQPSETLTAQRRDAISDCLALQV